MLLKLSGDIEENPGPNNHALLEQLLQSQKELLAKVTEIKDRQASSEAFLSQVDSRLQAIERKLESLDDVHNRLSLLDCAMSKIDSEMSLLTKRVDDIENRSRRNNLITGITEEDKETDEGLMRKVNYDIFEQILKVQSTSIERIHRIGKKINEKTGLLFYALLTSAKK